MESCKTGQIVQLIEDTEDVCNHAIGVVCDNDEDSYPYVKWLKRDMIMPPRRLRGDSCESRVIAVSRNYLRILNTTYTYDIGDKVVVIDGPNYGMKGVIIDRLGEAKLQHHFVSVQNYDVRLTDDTVITVDNTEITDRLDIVDMVDNAAYLRLPDSPICILDIVKYIDCPSDRLYAVQNVYYDGSSIIIGNNEEEEEAPMVNQLRLIKKGYPMSIGDKVVVVQNNNYSDKGDLGVVIELDLWDALPYRVQFEGSLAAWLPAHTISKIETPEISETVIEESDGFSKEIYFY